MGIKPTVATKIESSSSKVKMKDDWVSYQDSLIKWGLIRETYQGGKATYSVIILSLVALRGVEYDILA